MLILLSLLYSGFFNSNKEIDISNYSTSIYDYELTAIDGQEFDMDILKGKKILIVNVASKCGYTYQYEGLQKLSEK